MIKERNRLIVKSSSIGEILREKIDKFKNFNEIEDLNYLNR